MSSFQALDSFLLCLKLETGGKIIGYYKFVAGVALMLLLGAFIGITVAKLPIGSDQASDPEEDNLHQFHALFGFVGLMICFWVIFSSYELVQGCQTVSKERLGNFQILILFSQCLARKRKDQTSYHAIYGFHRHPVIHYVRWNKNFGNNPLR